MNEALETENGRESPQDAKFLANIHAEESRKMAVALFQLCP